MLPFGCVVTGIGHVIVAQTVLPVQTKHPDTAAPRAVGYPEQTLLVVEHTGVDVVWPPVAPHLGVGVGGMVIAGGQRLLFADDQFEVGFLPRDALVGGRAEAAIHHGTLIDPRAGKFVGCEQYDNRVPGIAVQAEILAPLTHRGVPHHVRRPHVAVHVPCGVVVAGNGTAPVGSIVVAEGYLLTTFRDGLGAVNGENSLQIGLHRVSRRIDCGHRAVVIHTGKRFLSIRPILHVAGIGNGTMRTDDVVAVRDVNGVIDHRRVVHADAFLRCGLRNSAKR